MDQRVKLIESESSTLYESTISVEVSDVDGNLHDVKVEVGPMLDYITTQILG